MFKRTAVPPAGSSEHQARQPLNMALAPIVNPYRPPTAEQLSDPGETAPVWSWKRILGWSVLIFFSASVLGVLSGLSLAWSQIYGDSYEDAYANARIVRRGVITTVVILLYWKFAVGAVLRPLLQVLVVWILLQFIDVVISLVAFNIPISGLFSDWEIIPNLGPAVVGLLLAYLTTHGTSRKPTTT